MMHTGTVINNTVSFVRQTLENAEAGHDWFHTERVWKTARTMAENEYADQLVIELAALLHDIADAKFYDGDESIGPRIAGDFLVTQGVPAATIEKIRFIIEHISFKGGKSTTPHRPIELDIIQDADRLDAIGAIGIARAFHYGGFKNRKLYDPSVPPADYADATAYRNSDAPTINHFYEKLLLLKDKMNTATGRAMAQERHQFMEQFLNQFYREWEGKLPTGLNG
ncbi:HD domain-containing protein [Flavihumibacter petaseus]|uniref:HD domain-containing protein n=1 Tax=Flavihumibacter petaseus NBRC 106054 TaxID=1220578 RepID=A0A0E9MYX2_9BACT|nr:HD domain-containing protein [Flavihumibacter petaseus]GAO42601.1 hypothetical protein FPE01S_01_16160 [Flavihumibacter petaseus NBRC 106054]